MDGAGRVLAVDAEADPRGAAVAEVAERLPQQRGREAAPAPLRAHTEHVDPAELRIAGEVPRIERDRRQLVPVLDEPPQRRVVAVRLGLVAPPALERLAT